VDSNSKIQGYNFYSMLHFRRKFSSGITAGKYHVTLSQYHNGVTEGHSGSHDEYNMRTMGEQAHSHSSKVYK